MSEVAGIILPKLTADGKQEVVSNPRSGLTDRVVVTHNYCDPTTWFQGSIRVTDEVAIDSGDGLTWNLANVNVIDMTHGKVYDEDHSKLGESHQYAVVVTVDAVSVSEQPPFVGTGGDYTVDYAAGTITFSSSQAGSTILVSYSYAGDSISTLTPSEGMTLLVEYAEVQFSDDVELTDTLVNGIDGYVEVFAPSLAVSNGGPIPDGTLIELDRWNYKTIDNVIEEAVGALPKIPAFGTNARKSTGRNVFPFRYNSAKALISSHGLRSKFLCENDIPLGGERVTITFYCVEVSG